MGVVVEKPRIDEAAIMAVLGTVPDPEIPVLTITDLGIVRGLADNPARVLISPTYTGCPATIAIEAMIREALDKAGFEDVHIERVLFPPWTTEWISERGRERLHAYGIAPPNPSATAECPLCGSTDTVEVSRFGNHPLQGAMALQRLPRTVGTLQVPLSAKDALTTPRSCRPRCAKTGLRQRWRSLSASRTAASSMSTPRPGPSGNRQKAVDRASALPCR